MIARRQVLAAVLAAALGNPSQAPALAEDGKPAAAAPQQARRTTMLGSRENEFLLAKITVSDLPRSYDFYTRVIGLKWATTPGMPPQPPPSPADPEKDFTEIPLNFSGSLADPFFVLVKLRGIVPTPETARLVWIGFKVPNAREAVARAAAAGAPVPRGVPGEGPMAFGFIRDPDGYNIEFVQAPPYPSR